MKKLLLTIAIAALTTAGFAEKIVVLDAQKVFIGSIERENLSFEMQKREKTLLEAWKKEWKENEERKVQYKKLVEDYQTKVFGITEEARKEKKEAATLLANVYDTKRVELKKNFELLKDKFAKLYKKITRKLHGEIQKGINEYAEKNAIDLILAKNSASLFNSKNIPDITDEVIKVINKGKTLKVEKKEK